MTKIEYSKEKELFDFVSEFAGSVKSMDFTTFLESDGKVDMQRKRISTDKVAPYKLTDDIGICKRSRFESDDKKYAIEIVENLQVLCRIGHLSKRIQVSFDIKKYDIDTIIFFLLWAHCRETEMQDKTKSFWDALADIKVVKGFMLYKPDFNKEVVLEQFNKIIPDDIGVNNARKINMDKMLMQGVGPSEIKTIDLN